MNSRYKSGWEFLSGRFLNPVFSPVCAFTIFFTPPFSWAFSLLHSFIHPLLSSSSLHRRSAAPPQSTHPPRRCTSQQSHYATAFFDRATASLFPVIVPLRFSLWLHHAASDLFLPCTANERAPLRHQLPHFASAPSSISFALRL